MKTQKPPPVGTAVRISLTLPSGSTIELGGRIRCAVGEGEMDGRGPGIDIALLALPQSVMWLIESALSSAGITPRPVPEQSDSAAATPASRKTTPPPPDSPDLADGDEWVSAEGDLVQALWQELNSMSKMNAFQLLDIPYTATDKDVRLAFGSLSKKYHPDRFTRYESFEIRELANEVFILMRNAYRALADEAGRQDALTAIEDQKPDGAGAPPIPRQRPVRTPPPKPISRAGTNDDAAPSQRSPGSASPKASSPTQSYSKPRPATAPVTPAPSATNTGANRVSMGMNVLESGQYEQALRILRAEARKDPDNITARAGVELAEGRLALANGDRMEAAERFEAALDIDPSNERAAREIADMRRHATSQRRGLLSKLMKKV